MGSKKIRTLAQLADYLGATHNTKESVARRLYKDTNCGIGFHADDKGVSVSGYCEGVDGDCPSYRLKWGFTEKEFDAQVEKADKDGCDMWDKTHGCDHCRTEEVNGYRPIDPKCPECHGGGQII